MPAVSVTQVIIDWITSLGWTQQPELDYALLDGTYIVEEPDRAVFITPTGGPGYVTEEGSADAWSFQARVRGTTDDPNGSLQTATLLDIMILHAPLPTTVDGVAFQNAYRAASPPTPLPVDPRDLRREYTCSYIIVTGV